MVDLKPVKLTLRLLREFPKMASNWEAMIRLQTEMNVMLEEETIQEN